MSSAVRVLAFAGARDVLGTPELMLALPEPCTAEALLHRVCEEYPALSPYRRSIRVAINGAYASPLEVVSSGDEVALIPPVAGG
jgi:molybdopterin synthase catalytic subunit/molybdopterin synthase sulfur carrier subunit